MFEHKDDADGVDALSAAALNEHMAGFGPFYGCDWAELEEDLPQGETIRIFDTDHVQFRLPAHGLTPTARIPQFLVDSAGKFAWGSTLYPDRLYVAGTREVCGNILADERLDAVRLW